MVLWGSHFISHFKCTYAVYIFLNISYLKWIYGLINERYNYSWKIKLIKPQLKISLSEQGLVCETNALKVLSNAFSMSGVKNNFDSPAEFAANFSVGE